MIPSRIKDHCTSYPLLLLIEKGDALAKCYLKFFMLHIQDGPASQKHICFLLNVANFCKMYCTRVTKHLQRNLVFIKPYVILQ